MVKFFYYTKLMFLGVMLGFFYSCNNQKKENSGIIKTVPSVSVKKLEKASYGKKGIKEMMLYKQNIMKPIGADKITYEAGYQMRELKKVRANGFTLKNASSIINVSERGPANVAGRARGIQIAPDNKDKWYAGAVGGGLWVTEDAGTTWKSLTDYKVPSLSVSTVAVSKTQPGIIYIGTGEPFAPTFGESSLFVDGIGIIKTINDGKNWTYMENTKTFGDIGRMVINPTDDDHLVVASASGIHYTLDGGKSWTASYKGTNNMSVVQDLVASPDDFNIMYGGVQNVGIVKSTDAGRSWNLIFDKQDYNPLHFRFELDISPVNIDKLLVSVFTSYDEYSETNSGATTAVNTDFYVSNDSGKTFTLLGFEGESKEGNLLTDQGWFNNMITAHPTDENIFYVGGVSLFKVNITDRLKYEAVQIAAGYENETLNKGVHVDQHNLVWQKGDNGTLRLILANDGGIYSTKYSNDPGTVEGDWSETAVGLNTTQFYGADKKNGSDNYIGGTQDNGSFIYTDTGDANKNSTYVEFLGGDGFEVLWNYDDPTKYIGSQSNNILMRFDGDNVKPAGHKDSYGSESPFYSKVANANNNPEVVFSPSSNGVWRSTDFAASWELTPLSKNYADPTSVLAVDVEVSVANPDVVWTGYGMKEEGSLRIFVSENNGLSYMPTVPFIDPRPDKNHNYFISGIEASPTDEKRAYVLFSSDQAAKVLKTEDLGVSWTDISGFSEGIDKGFPNVGIHSLLEMPYDKNTLWVGTDIGVIQTTDGGQSWKLLDEIPNVSVWQMKIVNDQVVMATFGRGIWTVTLEELKGYEPVAYFAPPSIQSVVQDGIENRNATATYIQKNKSTDKVTVYLDGVQIDEITDNIAVGVAYTYTFKDLQEGLHTVGFKASNSSGKTSVASKKDFDIIDFASPEMLVSVNVFEPEDIYTSEDDFEIRIGDSISNQNALFSKDYLFQNPNVQSAVLKRPIRVSEKNRIFTYEDFAILETIIEGGFKAIDYVVVEASSDLSDWKLLDKYNSSRFKELEDNTNENENIELSKLFKKQSLDLLKFFKEGEDIVIRFRLFSDIGTNPIWIIGSINKDDALAVDEVVATTMFSVYPTISNGELNIISGTNLKNSDIEVFGLNGQRVFRDKATLNADASYPISLGMLNPGMYMVKVSVNKNGGQVQRIIIK